MSIFVCDYAWIVSDKMICACGLFRFSCIHHRCHPWNSAIYFCYI